LISIDPRVKNKLQQELDLVLGNRPPNFDDVPNLTYTRAIIEETLRLYPPVPVLSRQAMAEDQIGDIKIDEGSIMLVVPWLLHRHEKYWDKPNHFIPERFTRDWPTRREKYAYVPFSTGPRICLGMAFGLTESILVLATLSQSFELSLEPDYVPDYECRLTLRPKHNLPMRLRQRR
jgi:cytochrome P450